MKMKWLAIGLVLLFLAMTCAPIMTCQMVTASQEDDLVEVTSQASGIQGYQDTTMKLTREQYRNLEQYLVEFRARLNQTSTREEAVPLFTEAVVELHKYGLLPRGMSVAQAQKLVLGWSPQQITTGVLKEWNKNQQTQKSNVLCLVAGELNNTYSIRRINNWLFQFLIRKYTETQSYFLIPFMMLFENRHERLNKAPLAVCDIVGIGYLNTFFDTYYNSSGWFCSVGVGGGIKVWNGEMVGTLPGPTIFGFIPLGGHYGYSLYADPGIWGFSGLKVLSGVVENKFYLGSALCVGINTVS